MQQLVWLALGYNVPVNPSKNRVYVWRKLKEFGAGSFNKGVAILPKNAASMGQFRGLAAKIRDMGGEATIAELKFCDKRDEAAMITRFEKQSEVEYMELIKDCANLLDDIRQNLFPPLEGSEHLKKMAKRYSKVRSRDYFKSRSQANVTRQLEDLAGDMAHVTGELGRQMAGLFSEK